MTRAPVLLAAALALLVACSHASDDAAERDRRGAKPARADLAASTTCGGRGNDCPLQSWMKANATPPMTVSDFARLERAFDRIVSLDPSELDYPRWRTIARAGASAARTNDLEGVRLSCKQCHDAYRERYRTERRAAPLR